MRIYTCHLVAETNTFASVPTGLASYEELGVHDRNVSLETNSGVFTVLAEWRRLAERDGHELDEGLAAQAQPGGTTVGSVYERFRDRILAQLAAEAPFDVILLNLHGAMVANGYDDCEGDLLARIRDQVGPDVVIGIELDLHCQFTEAMRSAADVAIAYKTYPHVDLIERAREVYAIATDAAEGLVDPQISMCPCQVVGLWRTGAHPIADLIDEMIAAEANSERVLSTSFGHGFPWADTPDTGATMWVVTDADPTGGKRLAEHFANRLWSIKGEAAQPYMTVEEAITAARTLPSPVILADGADNAGAGAPGDSTFVLRALLAGGHTNIASGLYYDPAAVDVCFNAGIGASLSLRVGGKTGPSSGEPVDLQVTVRNLIPSFEQNGIGMRWPLGRAAWVQAAGDIDLVLTSIRCQAFDPDAFQVMGISLMSKEMIVVKSQHHFRDLFEQISSSIIHLRSPGALDTDYAHIPYRKIARPFWPRDTGFLPYYVPGT